VKQFENEVSPVLPLPEFDPSLTTYIRDSMALVQCMDEKKHRTFGDLATDYWCYLWCKLSTKGQIPATEELGKLHFRTASLDLIYKISSLYHLHGRLEEISICQRKQVGPHKPFWWLHCQIQSK
jgi:hypothetical protein